MLENLIELVLPPIIAATELIGIFVVTVAVLKAFFHYLVTLLGIRGKRYAVKFELANGMATGLEFKMAAEILKTVQVRSFQELLVLGAIIPCFNAVATAVPLLLPQLVIYTMRALGLYKPEKAAPAPGEETKKERDEA